MTDTFTNTGLSSIAELKDLEELSISMLENDVDLSLLNSLSKLRRIELVFKRVRKPSPNVYIGSLANLPELEHLQIYLIDFGVTGLDDLENLKSLMIFGSNRLTEREVVSISKLKKLESLKLRREPPIRTPISSLSDLLSLTELSIHDSFITDSDLAHIAELTKLYSLYIGFSLGWSKITVKGLLHLKKLHELRYLTLCDTNTNDDGLAIIGELTELVGLALVSYRMPFTDNGLQSLTNLIHLTSLNLWGTGISDEALRLILELKNLEILNLGRTSITDKGLTYITNLESLKELSYRY